jgi:hypothetical protein
MLLDLLDPLTVVDLIKLDAALDTSNRVRPFAHVPLGIFFRSYGLLDEELLLLFGELLELLL